MRKILIFLFFITLATFCGAQPGYMGRRFSLGYDLCLKPAYRNWFDDDNSTKLGSGFNVGHQFQAGFVLNRKHEIYAAYMKGKIQDKDYDYEMTQNYIAYINVRGIRVGFRKYGGHSVAPIGVYQDFYWTTQSGWFAQPTYVQDPHGGYPTSIMKMPGGTYSLWKLGYGWGRRSIVTSTVYFDLGIEIQISQYFWDSSEIKTAKHSSVPSKYESGAIKDALRKEGGFLWFHFGLGYLAGKPKEK